MLYEKNLYCFFVHLVTLIPKNTEGDFLGFVERKIKRKNCMELRHIFVETQMLNIKVASLIPVYSTQD